jgi:hypothetical protein
LQYSLRTLFLLVLIAALLVSLAKALPMFSELMLVTAIAYAGFAGLAAMFQFAVKRGHVLLPVLVAFPAIFLYYAALVGTVVMVLGLEITGLSSI